MPNLSITIPSAVVYAIIIILGWWAVGYTINNTVGTWYLHRWLRAHKTSTVPDWFINICYALAGPVGWIAWVIGR